MLPNKWLTAKCGKRGITSSRLFGKIFPEVGLEQCSANWGSGIANWLVISTSMKLNCYSVLRRSPLQLCVRLSDPL